MPKVAFFPLHEGGLNALSEFQQENEILNYRYMKIPTQDDRWGKPHIAVLYIPKPEIIKVEIDGGSKSNDKIGVPSKNAKSVGKSN
jgi:hypothetical protein